MTTDDLPQSFETGAALGVFAAYRIPEFVPGGSLEFVCWKLYSDYYPLYRIPDVTGTALPPDLRDGGTFQAGLELTNLTALQEVRSYPPDDPDRPWWEYPAEVCLQCFALDAELFNQALSENRLTYLNEISPLLPDGVPEQQWGRVDYYEKYPKPLYEVSYDGARIALVNADSYTLAEDRHSLTLHQDFHSWRVWINDSPTDIRDAFSISPPVFSLTGPGEISIRETDELFVQRDSEQEHQF